MIGCSRGWQTICGSWPVTASEYAEVDNQGRTPGGQIVEQPVEGVADGPVLDQHVGRAVVAMADDQILRHRPQPLQLGYRGPPISRCTYSGWWSRTGSTNPVSTRDRASTRKSNRHPATAAEWNRRRPHTSSAKSRSGSASQCVSVAARAEDDHQGWAAVPPCLGSSTSHPAYPSSRPSMPCDRPVRAPGHARVGGLHPTGWKPTPLRRDGTAQVHRIHTASACHGGDSVIPLS